MLTSRPAPIRSPFALPVRALTAMLLLLLAAHAPAARAGDEPVDAAAAAGDAPVRPLATTDPEATRASAPDAAFFAENARRPGVVSLPSGAQARRISAGTGAAAAGADMVVVNLSRRGLLEALAAGVDAAGSSGSSGSGSGSGGGGGSGGGNVAALHEQRYRSQTLPLPLYEALQLMHVGDSWEVYVPAQTRARPTGGRADGKPAGRHRQGPALPATLFTVELLSAH
ncbi:MAG: hypothetical protein KGI67_08260 [Pseudomonadota bacterium]|nr:hypothetical protein [Pseudomonadota bacterium]